MSQRVLTKKASSNNGSKAPRKGLIARRKDSLTQKYIGKGYSQTAAKTMAEQRMRTEAVLAVVGTVAVTAVAIKAARRIGQDYVDQTFKSGKVIQNIGALSLVSSGVKRAVDHAPDSKLRAYYSHTSNY